MGNRSGVYKGATTQERVADRRRRLLDATLDVWAAAEAKVTMTAICASAGLTERYFYENFANLDDALTTVLDGIALDIEQLATSASDAAAAAGGDAESRMRASVSALLDYLRDDPRTGRVAIVEAGAMPSLRHRRTEILRHFARLSVDDAVEKAGLHPMGGPHSTVVGLLLIGGMAELITAWLDGAVETTSEEIVDATVRMYLGLYAGDGLSERG